MKEEHKNILMRDLFNYLSSRTLELTEYKITSIIPLIESYMPENKETLFSHVIEDDLSEIKSAKGDDKKKKMVALIEFFQEGFRREDLRNQTVDYKTWTVGEKGLMGNLIGICPRCGQLGELINPHPDFPHFKGSTSHIVKPFFMGTSEVEGCQWQERTQEEIDEIFGVA